MVAFIVGTIVLAFVLMGILDMVIAFYSNPNRPSYINVPDYKYNTLTGKTTVTYSKVRVDHTKRNDEV